MYLRRFSSSLPKLNRRYFHPNSSNGQFYNKLLKNNREWAEKVRQQNPSFFTNLANIQRPKVLWIGCSDSRLPPTDITGNFHFCFTSIHIVLGTQPGDIFVQRNVANMVIHTDMNLMSVLQYGVEILKVEHIIVCGHYNCMLSLTTWFYSFNN